jgi:hypothetical protein
MLDYKKMARSDGEAICTTLLCYIGEGEDFTFSKRYVEYAV